MFLAFAQLLPHCWPLKPMLYPCGLSSFTAAFDNSNQQPLQRQRILFNRLLRYLSLATIIFGMGCTQVPSSSVVSPPPVSDSPETPTVDVLPPDTAVPADSVAIGGQHDTKLTESWNAYRQRFIQTDGRVIDWESNSRTVSEGQAYAMLRAVLIGDAETFDLTLQWAEVNLKRSPQLNDADGQDYLWAWKWGERPDGTWGIQDANFASDADIDAITALILAARRWNRSDYLDLANKKLADLWAQSTLALPAINPGETNHYLLPGPLPAFQPQPGQVYLNPSYLAPYAFRLFAEVDRNPSHDWMALVDSSYEILEQTQSLSQQGLPADWVVFELVTKTIQVVPSGAPLNSNYSFDAYRVWWRIAWDAAWFGEPRAQQFLDQHLDYIRDLWKATEQIPAIISMSGQVLADYEATAQYAMLYPAFQQLDSEVADAIYNRKLLTSYQEGIWDNPDAYYVQNLAWLGLFPIEAIRSISML